MNLYRTLFVLVMFVGLLPGCAQEPHYGSEMALVWSGNKRLVWAIAPAVDLSGQKQVDPLLQGDLVFQQVQEVTGITAIPVNRVVEVYASLHIDRVQSEEQAALVCDLLGCDALLIPTVTAYDAYNPPKFGAALQLFGKPMFYARPANVDVRELVRSATPGQNESVQPAGDFIQVVGMYDAANGSVREDVFNFAHGRNDPKGPLGAKEYFVNMDRFCAFAYHKLIGDLINEVANRGPR